MARNIYKRLYEEESMELDRSRRYLPVRARRRAQQTARLPPPTLSLRTAFQGQA